MNVQEPQDRSDLVIRNLVAGDLDRLVRMDQKLTGRARRAWYEGRLRRALNDTDINVSLGAESQGMLAGAVLAGVHFGEYGLPEPVAVLDTVLVDPELKGRGIAMALLSQLVKNLEGLRIERIRTEVGWDELELVGFMAKVGFRPVPRLVLERSVRAD